jgi:hypothetical protein
MEKTYRFESAQLFNENKRRENIRYLYQELLPTLARDRMGTTQKIEAIHAATLEGSDYTLLENTALRIRSDEHREQIRSIKPGTIRNRRDAEVLGYKTTMKGRGDSPKMKGYEISLPCPSDGKVAEMLDEFSSAYERIHSEKDATTETKIKSALFFSNLLVLIHPFYDGNGRTARGLFTTSLLEQGEEALYLESTDPKVRQFAIDKNLNFFNSSSSSKCRSAATVLTNQG